MSKIQNLNVMSASRISDNNRQSGQPRKKIQEVFQVRKGRGGIDPIEERKSEEEESQSSNDDEEDVEINVSDVDSTPKKGSGKKQSSSKVNSKSASKRKKGGKPKLSGALNSTVGLKQNVDKKIEFLESDSSATKLLIGKDIKNLKNKEIAIRLSE